MSTLTEQRNTYRVSGRKLWDPWIIWDEKSSLYRMFHLDAPDSAEGDERDNQACIRSAISKDFLNWQDAGQALTPSPTGEWDDLSIWSGNTYLHDGTYYLFYTGRCKRDGYPPEKTQRIGLAKSQDAVNWSRGTTPLLVPDGRWYETSEFSPICRAWRDPAIVQDPDSKKFYMFFTAKVKDGDPTYRAAIGLAVSDSMDGPYECLPPVLAPGIYAEMEVPQVVFHEGKVYLFFSTFAKNYEPAWAEKVGGAVTALHCYVADSLLGTYKPLQGTGIVSGSENRNLYSVKLIRLQGDVHYSAYGWFLEDEGSQDGHTFTGPLSLRWENGSIQLTS